MIEKKTLRLVKNSRTAKHQTSVDGSKEVARFTVRFTQILNSKAELKGTVPEFAVEPEFLIEFYRAMVLTRTFDKRAVALQRTGQLGTYASSLGQEAIGAALGTSMNAVDVLVPAYREYAAQFLRGVSMTEILLYWGGSEAGMDFKSARHDFPLCVPIASQIPQAVGVAYAMKLRREPRVAVCVLGDGASSKGDFYEALNAAGIWQLPIVFVINNNQWAISLPRSSQSAAETLAQKAFAAGISGEQVDGNDVIAVYDRFSRALDKARKGQGPSLIEAITYRLCDHTTADDASRYRPAGELDAQQRRDPLIRLRKYLSNRGCWSLQQESTLTKTCRAEVEAAVDAYLATAKASPGAMFDYLYENLPEALISQREFAMQQERDRD